MPRRDTTWRKQAFPIVEALGSKKYANEIPLRKLANLGGHHHRRFLVNHPLSYISTLSKTMPSALLLIAEGTEEMEVSGVLLSLISPLTLPASDLWSQFTITYDVLVRGGVNVKSAYVGSSAHSGPDDPHGTDFVTCSRGVKIVPDLRLPDLAGGKALEEYDAIVVPGGNKGAEIISSNEDVTKLISAFYGKGKVVACICAGESKDNFWYLE